MHPISDFHHVALHVRDVRSAEIFYTTVLGFAITNRHHTADGTLRSIWFACGDGILMIEAAAEGTVSTASSPLVALRIRLEDRQPWKEKLEKANVAILKETPHSFYFRDPEGNHLALSHYPAVQG